VRQWVQEKSLAAQDNLQATLKAVLSFPEGFQFGSKGLVSQAKPMECDPATSEQLIALPMVHKEVLHNGGETSFDFDGPSLVAQGLVGHGIAPKDPLSGGDRGR